MKKKQIVAGFLRLALWGGAGLYFGVAAHGCNNERVKHNQMHRHELELNVELLELQIEELEKRKVDEDE